MRTARPRARGARLQRQNRVNLDGAAMRRGILGRPGLRLGPVLAVQDEVAVEPWRLSVHWPIAGFRSTVADAHAEACCRRLAGVAVLVRPGRLYLVEVVADRVARRFELVVTVL